MGAWEEQLNAILSSPETMEQIRALAGSLTSGSDAAEPETGTPEAAPEPVSPPEGGLGSLLSGVEPGVLGRVLPLVQEYQSGGGERQALLAALKPFLRKESQAKVERAMQLARLSRVIRASIDLMGEGGHV